MMAFMVAGGHMLAHHALHGFVASKPKVTRNDLQWACGVMPSVTSLLILLLVCGVP